MRFAAAVAAASVAGLASASAQYDAPKNGTAPAYVTEVVTAYTTYCPEATEITHAGETYTVSEATTLTITNCPGGKFKHDDSIITSLKLTFIQDALSSSPPLLLSSLSASTAPLPPLQFLRPLRFLSSLLRPQSPPSRHPPPLSRLLRRLLLSLLHLLLTLRPTAPPRSLLPLLLALALPLSPPLAPLLSRVLPLPSPPPVLVSSPSSVSSLSCKRLQSEDCKQTRPNLYDYSKGSEMPTSNHPTLVYLTFFFLISSPCVANKASMYPAYIGWAASFHYLFC